MQQVEKEKNKIDVTHHTFCQQDKSDEVEKNNLPTEDKRTHKFTKEASGEREKTNFMTFTMLFVRMIKVMKWRKVTYTLRISECTSSEKQRVEKEKNKIDVTHHSFHQNDKSYKVEKSNLPTEYK